MLRKKIRTLLFIIGSLAAIWWLSLLGLQQYALWCLQKNCSYYLGLQLNYQQASWHGKELILQDVTLSPCMESQSCASFSHIHIEYALDWFRRRLVAEVTIPSLQWQLNAPPLDFQKTLELFQSDPSFFAISGKLQIQEGVLIDLENSTQFSLQGELEENGHFAIQASINSEEKSEEGTVKIVKKDQWRTQLHFREMDIKRFYNLFKPLSPQFKDWNVRSGVLTGDWSINDSQMRGALILENFESEMPKKGISIGFKKIEILENGHPDQEQARFTAGTIEIGKHTQTPWKIADLEGALMEVGESLSLRLAGTCLTAFRPTPLMLKGDIHLKNPSHKSVDMTLSFQGDTAGRVVWRQWDKVENSLEIDLHHFGPREFTLFQHFSSPQYPWLQTLSFETGDLGLKAHAYFSRGWPSEIHITRLDGQQMKFTTPWNLQTSLETICGSFKIDISQPDISKTISGDLSLLNGQLQMQTADRKDYLLRNVNARVHLDKGMMKKSQLEAELAGLKGNAAIDWNHSGKCLSLHVTGGLSDLAGFLPEESQDRFLSAFGNDSIAISATASIAEKRISIEGAANVFEEDEEGEFIDFAFNADWPEIFSQALCRSWPPLVLRAEKLPMEKYLSPFVFDQDKLQLSGLIDAEAILANGNLRIDYNAHQMVVEHENYIIEIEELGAPHKKFSAHHMIDLDNFSHQGNIPVAEGRYYLKKCQLEFNPISCNIQVNDMKIQVRDIEAMCEGVCLGGDVDVDLDYAAEGEFSATIQATTFAGQIPHIQKMLRHFNQTHYLLKMPLDGTVAFYDKGGYVHLHFYPDDYTCKMAFQAHLFNGRAEYEAAHVSLHELTFNFAYDHQADTLLLDDIQGAVFLGPLHYQEEYSLGGQAISFTRFSQNEANFDLWLNNSEKELFRLAGHSEGNQDSLEVHFDRALTHFGKIHPDTLHLAMNGKWGIDTLDFHSHFTLDTLFNDLSTFRHTGFLFLSRHLLGKLHAFQNVAGEIQLAIRYEPETSSAFFETTGSQIVLDDHAFQTMLITGKKKGPIWTIDQLQLDRLSFATDFYPREHDWKINFIGARLGESILLGLEGYLNEGGDFEGKINLVEVDTAKLGEWSLLQFLQERKISGYFKGQGAVKISSTGEIDALLNSSIRDLKIEGLSLADADNISCHLNSAELSLRNIETSLLGPLQTLLAPLQIGKLSYNKNSKQLELENLVFCISSNKLSPTLDILGQNFPELFTPYVNEMLGKNELQAPLRGILERCCWKEGLKDFQLVLDPHSYHFCGMNHELSKSTLSYDGAQFQASSIYRFQENPYLIRWKGLSEGCLEIFSLQESSTKNQLPPLKIQWAFDSQQRPCIKQVEGQLPGLTMHLHDISSSSPACFCLGGDILIDTQRIAPLLTPEQRETLQNWQIGSVYDLSGIWSFTFDHSGFIPMFEGTMRGENFICKGYQFQHFTSHVTLQPEFIRFEQMNVYDPAAKCDIGTLELRKKEQGNWIVTAPSIEVHELRPALLREAFAAAGYKQKALVIQSIHMQNLAGSLTDSRSLTADGTLYFTNPQKKNLPNILFAIPAELLSRLGLDLSMLTPVSGHIDFTVEEGKIILKEFRDMYSDGKISKFFLANEGTIDFDGHLNVQVRLKQFNVLLKIAELFTIQIQGTIKKPAYNILRPAKGEERI